ncbi:LysE family translocator [Dokdonella soli]|uniref:LysE family translocator n=1 Tax=Dokdonella soli TaxID=529810 RepID=A0ABN1IE23_9GAMM
MTSWIAIAGLITVAALTPGPNNLIVLRAAARSGVIGAVPAIAGVVSGGLTLLVIVMAGAGALFTRWPALNTVLAISGASYLAWLGGRLIAPKAAKQTAPTISPTESGPHVPETGQPRAGALGAFGFQFLNPKGWVMVITATSATQASAGPGVSWRLALLFVLIPAACLFVWSSLGVLMSESLRRPRVRRGFDCLMGVLLLASSLLLLADA